MPDTPRGNAAPVEPQVWILGSSHPCADKSIEWDDPMPNLSDSDVIIVDLTTLTEDVLEGMDEQKIEDARLSIKDRYCTRGTIIVIMKPHFHVVRSRYRYSNYHMLPVDPETVEVPKGSRISWGPHEIFQAYKDYVEGFSFYMMERKLKIRPQLAIHPHVDLLVTPDQIVTDHSYHLLGCMLTMVEWDKITQMTPVPETGELFLLPPPTKPIQDAIGSILSVYGKTTPRGQLVPEWATKLSLAAADQLGAEIAGLEKKMDSLRDEISARTAQRDDILAHRRLLYAKGPDLEDAVGLAFKALGFAEITRRGGRDAEDWIFDASTNGYQRAVVEVKGADKRTKHRHIVQCNKWADDLAGRTGESVKGVLVANQYCNSEYLGPIEGRIFFEANELDYAHRKDVCIIPSCDLYEAVKEVLDGAAPDRDATERKITGAKGVLRDVL